VKRGFLIVVGVLVVVGLAVDGYAVRRKLAAEKEFAQQVQLANEEGERIRATVLLPTAAEKMHSGENFAAALVKLGLTENEAAEATTAAQSAFNLRQLRAGNAITIERSVEGKLREIHYKIDAERMLKIAADAPSYHAKVEAIPTHQETVGVRGELHDSLFNAVEEAGESPEVAMRLAQIFGYDLDFYTDPRKGDTFRVVVEKKRYASGETAAYGKILAAEYDNAGKKYQAILFHDDAGVAAYYTAEGKSLQKAFLRSPLKFAAPVTSHFSKARFHPILKTYRPHLGTDYGAPVGTPVQTIGSGKVTFAGRKGGEGNMIKIAHANGYETMYLHLSRMFVLGKTIGLVGSTGLSTGPHLDFRIAQRGEFKNFERLGLPPSEPVSKRNWAEFAAVRGKVMPMLEGEERQLVASGR